MRAVIADGFGGSWSVVERPNPEPGPDEVVIEIEASGICYTDIQQLRNPNYHGTFPRVPGHEPVGTVVALGSNVDAPRIGERVGAASNAGADPASTANGVATSTAARSRQQA